MSNIPSPEYPRSLDQLKMNLRNLFETAKILDAVIKKREKEIADKYAKKV